ncbi:MAG TPA: hypothetical protein VNZ94_00365 [Xanthobacteraceae bacterium]|nr:hypothetical protein [Xanthobacteraceae bacterium]
MSDILQTIVVGAGSGAFLIAAFGLGFVVLKYVFGSEKPTVAGSVGVGLLLAAMPWLFLIAWYAIS